MKRKTYKFSILALALVICLSVAAFFSINFIRADADGTVTVSDSNVFTSTKSAEGNSSSRRIVVADRQNDDNPIYYTMFRFAYDDDTVSYRRNLAYHWFYGEPEEGAEKNEDDYIKSTGREGWFNMEIGFNNTSFEKFTITFESQQYNKSKDSKSLNYIIFYPAGQDRVNVVITDDKDEKPEEDAPSIEAGYIYISFIARNAGNYGTGTYTVSVSDAVDASEPVIGCFENIGGNYSKSSTSSTSPVYPLIFNAKLGEEKKAADMVLYSLNGQSFQVNKNTSSTSSGLNTSTTPSHDSTYDYYYGGTVYDNVAPVLCMTKEFTHFGYGDKVDFDYVLVDVLRSSPSETLYYYVLTVDQYKSEEIEDYNEFSLFGEAKDNVTLVSGVKENYLPAANDIYKNEELTLDSAVKVYLKLTDTTSNGATDYVYLDWYINEDYLLNIKGTNFVAVAKDSVGVTYNYDENGKTFSTSETGVVAQYQAKVDEAAKNLMAGSSSYFYLPSAEILFSDNATAYTDMKFNIYFYHNSQSSNTSLSANNLSINLTQSGHYAFTIYATDAAGNKMYYLDGNEQDGYEKVEIDTGDIWDMYKDRDDLSGGYYRLPWFHFDVDYAGADFEETPGLQSTAYVGTSYNSASFKINGISGTYTTVYRLFLFDRAAYYNNEGETFTYEEFIENMDDLFKNHREYFDEIPEVTESDADYEKYKDYGWSKTSTSFTPQDENAFYYMRAEITNQYNNKVTSSLAVVASVNAKTIKGESDWLKNNLTSVILLCVAGLALIGIILLLVIKPKDKTDIDIQYENAKKKNKTDKK